MCCSRSSWRIRLAAYVARLERGLGAIPQGFKSPILRKPNQLLTSVGSWFFHVLGILFGG